MRLLLRRLVPDLPPVSYRERLRASLGAGLGVLATAFVSRLAIGEDAGLPFLVAPVGASAVLLFALPASPLAQPWAVIGGNLVASLVGVTAAQTVADPVLAVALAVPTAIVLMLSLRCLHPPSGAVALSAILGGEAVRGLGYGFVFWPVLANSLLLLAAALLFNNATGRRYPHAAAPAPALDRGTRDPVPTARIGVSAADIDEVLADLDQLIDIDRSDLEVILKRAEQRAMANRAGPGTCADIMSRDVVGIDREQPIAEALELLRLHRVSALPVTGPEARVVGLVAEGDLLYAAMRAGGRRPSLAGRLRLRRLVRRGAEPEAASGAPVVGDVMRPVPILARPATPLGAVVPLMADSGLHHLPVTDGEERLVGLVTQTDVLVALLAGLAGTPEPVG